MTISRVTFLLLCTNTSLDAEQTVRSDYSPLNCRDLLTVCCSVELTPARASVLAGFPRLCAIRSSFFFTKTPWLPGNVWTRVLFKKDFTKKKAGRDTKCKDAAMARIRKVLVEPSTRTWTTTQWDAREGDINCQRQNLARDPV